MPCVKTADVKPTFRTSRRDCERGEQRRLEVAAQDRLAERLLVPANSGEEAERARVGVLADVQPVEGERADAGHRDRRGDAPGFGAILAVSQSDMR